MSDGNPGDTTGKCVPITITAVPPAVPTGGQFTVTVTLNSVACSSAIGVNLTGNPPIGWTQTQPNPLPITLQGTQWVASTKITVNLPEDTTLALTAASTSDPSSTKTLLIPILGIPEP